MISRSKRGVSLSCSPEPKQSSGPNANRGPGGRGGGGGGTASLPEAVQQGGLAALEDLVAGVQLHVPGQHLGTQRPPPRVLHVLRHTPQMTHKGPYRV